MISGLFPFGSIFIEIFYIFTSFWSYKFYFVYGFMLFVFCILCITCICVTIVGTYVLLNSENYHWHWTSFMSSGKNKFKRIASTAIYVYIYGIYFLYFKTKMAGFMQLSFYYGYLVHNYFIIVYVLHRYWTNVWKYW